MLQGTCPSCGAPLIFKSSVSVFAVCPFCRSTVVRHDLDLSSIGTMAVLKDDCSPLQLGTQGRYRGVHFSLVGRIVRRWSDGTWNEWLAYFDDARTGWLGEAQGFYSLSFLVADSTSSPPKLEDLSPGHQITLSNRAWTVADIKETTCSYSEGELPFKAINGRKTVSVDLTSTSGQFACIEYADEGIQVYQGEYLKFEDLALRELRELDGW